MIKNKLYIGVFIGVILVAFFLRVSTYISGDFFFLQDQGRDMLLVREIVENKKITLIGGHAGFGGLFHGPLWLYMLIPSYIASHGDPFFTLVPVYLFISMGIVLIGGVVSYYLYGLRTALLYTFILAISQFFISTSTFTSNSQVMPLLFLLYLFSIIMYLRGKEKFLIASFLFIGLGMHFESAFAVMLLPVTVFGVLLKKKIPSIKIILYSALVLVATVSNFIFFDLRHQFLMTNSVVRLLTGKFSVSQQDQQYASILGRFLDRGRIFITSFGYPTFQQNQYILLFVSILLLGLLAYCLLNIRKKNIAKEYIFLCGAPVIIFMMYMLYPMSLQAHYILSVPVLTILLFSLALSFIYRYFLGKLVIVLFIGIQIVLVGQGLVSIYSYPKDIYSKSTGSYKNQLAAADWVYKDANRREFGYFVYDPPIVTYGMDYLMWWRGNTAYSFIPKSEKLPLTYLIMYPPPLLDPGSHAFWIKNVVRTKGELIQAKVFSNNIKIIRVAIPAGEESADVNYSQNLLFR